MQKHHEQISWTTKSTKCYMYGKIGATLADLGLGLMIIRCSRRRSDDERKLCRRVHIHTSASGVAGKTESAPGALFVTS